MPEPQTNRAQIGVDAIANEALALVDFYKSRVLTLANEMLQMKRTIMDLQAQLHAQPPKADPDPSVHSAQEE